MTTHIAAGPAPLTFGTSLSMKLSTVLGSTSAASTWMSNLRPLASATMPDETALPMPVPLPSSYWKASGHGRSLSAATPAPLTPVQHCVALQPVGRVAAEVGGRDHRAGVVGGVGHARRGVAGGAAGVGGGDADDVRAEPLQHGDGRVAARHAVVGACRSRRSRRAGRRPASSSSCRTRRATPASLTVTMMGTEPERKPAPPSVPCVSPAGGVVGRVVARLMALV